MPGDFDDYISYSKYKHMNRTAEVMEQKVAEKLTQQLDKKFLEGLYYYDFPKSSPKPSPKEDPMEHISDRERLVAYPREGSDYRHSNNLDCGPLEYHNVRELLARFFLSIHYNMTRIHDWRPMCIGITSLLGQKDYRRALGEHEDLEAQNVHMPVLDFDGKNIKTKVKKSVKKVQQKYALGDATLFLTKGGMHVYFFSDAVSFSTLVDIINDSNCCRGFAQATKRHKNAVLRVSAKYTSFDIEFDQVIPSKHQGAKRPYRKAYLVQELIRLGQECGTHIASLYPQWANFQEDPKEWSPPRAKNKKIRKVRGVKTVATGYKMASTSANMNNNWISVNIGTTTSTSGGWR